jgi:hypothetical protein
MRYLARISLILALLGGPFACLPQAEARATNAAIGGLMAVDLDTCIQNAHTWTAYDRCEAELKACALTAKTVGEYDACSDRVTGRAP